MRPVSVRLQRSQDYEAQNSYFVIIVTNRNVQNYKQGNFLGFFSMWHTVLNIYGPLSIHGYGLMIALGLLVFLYLLQRDPRFIQLKLEDRLSGLLIIGILAALFGGRILFFITNPEFYGQFIDLFTFFKGGFSILGSVLAVFITLSAYLYYLKIPIVPFFDLIALYTPLLQSIARIGCFFAGCCYGLPTSAPWAIIYTDQESIAPLYVCLHPTQLYSAIGLLLIFVLLYFVLQYRFTKPGQLGCLYLLLIGLERFIVEYWRGDEVTDALFSLNQYVAAALIIGALVGLGITYLIKIKKK